MPVVRAAVSGRTTTATRNTARQPAASKDRAMMTPHLARIARQPSAQAAVNEQYHPYGTADTPMVMPLTRVQIGSTGLAYDELTPLVMPDGRMVPATAPHTWFQLYAAGRP